MNMKKFSIVCEYLHSDTYEKIAEFNNKCNKFEYGLARNGIIDKSIDTSYDDWKLWRMASPIQFEKQGGGVCWDYVTYEADYFKKNFPELKVTAYYIIFVNDKDDPTHTFITINVDNKYVYFESSFKKIKGVYIFDTESDVLNFVMTKMNKYRPKGCEDLFRSSRKYKITKYNALDKKLIGCSIDQFMDYCYRAEVVDHMYSKKYNDPIIFTAF